jgi:hypothetical protein
MILLLWITADRNLGDCTLTLFADLRGGATWLCQAEALSWQPERLTSGPIKFHHNVSAPRGVTAVPAVVVCPFSFSIVRSSVRNAVLIARCLTPHLPVFSLL